MARLDVLERPQTDLTEAEKKHLENKDECLRLLYSDTIETEKEAAPVQKAAPVAYGAPVAAPERRAADTGYSRPQLRHTQFDDVLVKERAVVIEAPRKTAPAPVPAPVPEISPSPAHEAAPKTVYAPSEEDALPTRRTMNTLHHSAAQTATEQKTSLFAGVSTRAKVVLAAIAFAIVLAIVVICINTGIIKSLDANVENLRAQAQHERQVYEDLDKQIKEADAQMKNQEGPMWDRIKEYAEAHGMVRG